MALTFNGSSYLTRSAALFSGDATDYNFSVSAWVKPTGRHTGSIIGSDAGSGNAGRFALFLAAGYFNLRRSAGFITGPDQVSNDNTDWFHVLGTWQYGSRALYVNGVSVATETSNIYLDPTAGTTFYIGRDHSGKYFNGVIAEAAAYSVYLSASDVAPLAAGFSPLFIQPDKLIGYWPLGGTLTPATSGIEVTASRNLTTTGTLTEATHPYQVWPAAHQNIIYPLTPAAIVPGQGHDYALPGNRMDYAANSKNDFTTPRQAADYGVPNDGT